jgi:hypothetical protein
MELEGSLSCPPMVFVLTQINPTEVTTPGLFKMHFNIVLAPISGVLLIDFSVVAYPPKSCLVLLFPLCATCPARLISRRYRYNYILRRVQIVKPPIMSVGDTARNMNRNLHAMKADRL